MEPALPQEIAAPTVPRDRTEPPLEVYIEAEPAPPRGRSHRRAALDREEPAPPRGKSRRPESLDAGESAP